MEKDIKEGITIIIPSKTEKFLRHTILDVLEKAEGDIEVVPILDGYDVPEDEIVVDDRVKYIKLEPTRHAKKRQGINLAVSLSKNKFVMSSDAHCMFAKGFDTVLKRDWQPKWVMVPRRNRLDAENWCLQIQNENRPPIDYEYVMFPSKSRGWLGIHGFRWDKRTYDRWDIPIDDIMTMQASCWFMSKEWFNQMGFMQVEGYMGWGQEAEEICFTTWMNGGKCKVDKNTWYAHLHKGKKYGRMYWMSRDENRQSYAYSWNKWMHENQEFFFGFLEKFMPMPGWPKDWKEQLVEMK